MTPILELAGRQPRPSAQVLAQAKQSVAMRRHLGYAVLRTPCLVSRMTMSDGTTLVLKTENLQRTGSFKLRGAITKLSTLPRDVPLVVASSGNHGIACAHAARSTGQHLTVVLPESVAALKLARIADCGVRTILVPGDTSEAERRARAMVAADGGAYVSPYNDMAVIAGQGTIALEILEQVPWVDNVFVAMGGGGLVAGVGSVLRAFSPGTRVIAVSAANSAALAASLEAGRVVSTQHNLTLADAVAGGLDEDAITLPIAAEVIDTVVLCSEEQIAKAMRALAWVDGMLVEGAAALALAGYLADPAAYAGQVNVVILCGSNVDAAVAAPIVGRAEGWAQP